MTLGLTQEQRELHQNSLVKLYHKTLLENASIEYDIDHCWHNIRRGLLYSVFCNTIAAARQNKERIAQLDAAALKFVLDIYFGRIDAALRSVDIFKLLPL
jgi:hypothetical protein